MSAPKPGEFGEPWEFYDQREDEPDSNTEVLTDPELYPASLHSSRPDDDTIAAGQNRAYLKRARACVNALDGRDPAALETLTLAAASALSGMDGGADDAVCHRGITTREKCHQCGRKDGLRAALEAFGVEP